MLDEIARNLAEEEVSSSGESCSFIDLENGWGIKCFYDRENCNISHYCQNYLSKHELAPKAGNKFVIEDWDGCKWHCYLTEVAETIVGYGNSNAHAFAEDDDEEEEQFMLFRDERDAWLFDFEELTKTIYYDDHVGNWGFIKIGEKRKLVVIDFDLCRTTYKKLKGIQ